MVVVRGKGWLEGGKDNRRVSVCHPDAEFSSESDSSSESFSNSKAVIHTVHPCIHSAIQCDWREAKTDGGSGGKRSERVEG